MLKSTYLQQCAHNLHERRTIGALLREDISAERKHYLSRRLRHLQQERNWFLKIKEEFNIWASDCWKL